MRPKSKWPRILFWIAAVCLVFVLLVGGGTALWVYRETRPPAVTGSQVPVQIIVNKGESVTEIGQELERANLIRHAYVFRMYVRYTHASHSLQAGIYEIKPGSTLSAIANQLRAGKVVTHTVAVTIPEGFTVAEIADKLAADRICTKQAFLDEVQHGNFTEPFIRLLPKNKAIKHRLEGYLFPDTYKFQQGQSAHFAVDVMLQNFQQHIDAANLMATLKTQGKTLPTLITEASMIEKEARVKSDMPLIASVIDNRLKKGMKLQIDATILYVLGHRNIVTDKDLQVRNAYNTYLHTGLPPGPISSPGMTTIEAALHPAKTSYLYYVAKYDGSGTSYFSATEAQHLVNTRRSEMNLRNSQQSPGKSSKNRPMSQLLYILSLEPG